MTDKIIEKLKLFLKKDDIPIKCADNATIDYKSSIYP